MECIRFGVPMVIVPGLRDQPGNSTRAVRHGLGVRARLSRITGDQLVGLIERVMNDQGFRRAVGAMRRAIAEDPGDRRCVELIESHATRPAHTGVQPRAARTAR